MFAKHKAKEAKKKYDIDLATWQSQFDALSKCVELAKEFNGEVSS